MRRDDILLLDMLLAAREAVEFAEGLTFEAFQRNRMAQLAILKSVETVGEAAARIGVDTRDAHPEIPWAGIVGMRNRLVHEYFNVNLARVWEAVERDIPCLIPQLEGLIPPESEWRRACRAPEKAMTARIAIPAEPIAAFCERWQVTELALFGSVLREDFGPASDIDMLVAFAEEARHSLFDMVRMEAELKDIFGREVDLVSRRGIERSRNHLRRKAILGSAETIHER